MVKMLSLRGQFLFCYMLQFYVYGEANIYEEFQTNFQSLYNFIDDLRIASDTLPNFFTKIQAVICPEQPICSSEGSQDRHRILASLPRYLDIGTNSIPVESISDYVGICCLPCSCSDTCFEQGYCCLSKFLNRSVTEQERSDVFTSESEDETRSVGDKSGTSDIADATSVNRLSNEIPRLIECVPPSAKMYDRDNTGLPNSGYFMITRCSHKAANKTLVHKCEAPSADEIDETIPVTSLRTGHIYSNQHCALCNKDGLETSRWRSIADFGNVLVFFANTSDIPAFPSTPDELHQLALYQGDIIYSPPFPMEDKRCLVRLEECNTKTIDVGKNVRDIPWLLEACKQYTSPIKKKQFYTTKQYRMQTFRNIFCFFCRENETGLLENSRCSLNLESSRHTSVQLTGLIDYKPRADPKSSANKQLKLGNGNCLCGEIYDKNLDYCRPVLCPPGDFMTGCQCVQLVKNLSGVPVLIYLKVVPELGKLPNMTAKQIRTYDAALLKTLQNTVDEITAEPVATFKQQTETGENFLSLVLVRSNPDHDTRETLKPFLDYLDSPKKMEMLTGKTFYFVRLTSRLRMWAEFDKLSFTVSYRLIDFDTKEQDPPLVHADWHSLTKVYTQNTYQVFSPLLYCRQVLLDGKEFFERDGTLVLNITSPELSMPYYYRVTPNTARVCVKQFLRNHKNAGAKLGHTVLACLIMFGFVLLYWGSVIRR